MQLGQLNPALFCRQLRALVRGIPASLFIRAFFLFVIATVAGCSCRQAHVNRIIEADKATVVHKVAIPQSYTLGCPDLLDIQVLGRTDFSGRKVIGLDGCLDMGPGMQVQAEGLTLDDVTPLLGKQLGVPATRVRVRVAKYNSRVIYLSGSGTGVPRAVPYQGPETVLDLLKRTGGLQRGAAPDKVQVTRQHVFAGDKPEVFPVDLQAIVTKNDQRTNVILRPFDRVHVGQTRQGKIEKCLPRWMQPVYQAAWGMRPKDQVEIVRNEGSNN